MDRLVTYPILDGLIIPYLNQFVKKKIEPSQKKFLDQLLNSIGNFYTPAAKYVPLVNGIVVWLLHDIE